MTKAKTKGEAKRAKRGRPAHDGDREPNGRLQRDPKPNSVRMTMIEARARRLGVWPAELIRGPGETDEQFSARQMARQGMIRAAALYVTQPWMGCNAGRAIASRPDVVALWEVITLIRIGRRNYLDAIGAPPDEAKGINLPVATSDVDENGDVRITLLDDRNPFASAPRSEEEDADAAIDAWESLAGIIYRLGPGAEEAIIATVILDEERPAFRLPWALAMIRKALNGEELPKGLRR